MKILMLIGIGVLALILFFGKNPIREFQNEAREMTKKYGNDDITIATTYYIEQKQKEGSGSIFGGGSDGGGQPAASVSENDMKSSMTNSGRSLGRIPVNSDSSATVKIAPPDNSFPEDISINVRTDSQGDAATKTQQSGAIKNYYPPIVGESNTAVYGNTQQAPPPSYAPRLRSGQVIAFEGESVYLLDQYGVKSIMPDGSYNLLDGSRMTVMNGKRIIQ